MARTVQAVQWSVVAAYVVLVVVPAFLPIPPEDAHWYDSLIVAAQWLFWGLWWPFMIASMFVLGRTWCGVFCPEGTLTEAASRHGLGLGVPRWMRWGGWPFVAFALTTVFGQFVSVYQYATATLLVLGGSTLAAVAVGFVYGKGKRVWCRHLSPVNGVFAILARISPLHFRVDSNVVGERGAGPRTSGELCANGSHPADDGTLRMPHVRALQRRARCRRACSARTCARNRANRSSGGASVGCGADRVRNDRACNRRFRMECHAIVRRSAHCARGPGSRARSSVASRG